MDKIDKRRERAARNQSLFREVNEQIAELSHRFRDVERPSGYLCECLNTDCWETIEVPFDEYERLRARGTRFFVLPGHEEPVVEEVVETTPRYVVVEKIGVAGDIADSVDPRRVGSAS